MENACSYLPVVPTHPSSSLLIRKKEEKRIKNSSDERRGGDVTSLSDVMDNTVTSRVTHRTSLYDTTHISNVLLFHSRRAVTKE